MNSKTLKFHFLFFRKWYSKKNKNSNLLPPFLHIKTLKIRKWLQKLTKEVVQNGSMSKGHQAEIFEIDPHNQYGGRKEPTYWSCSLLSYCVLHAICCRTCDICLLRTNFELFLNIAVLDLICRVVFIKFAIDTQYKGLKISLHYVQFPYCDHPLSPLAPFIRLFN